MNLGGLSPYQSIGFIKRTWPEIYDAIVANYIVVKRLDNVYITIDEAERDIREIGFDFDVVHWSNLIEERKRERMESKTIDTEKLFRPDEVFPIPKEGIKHDSNKPRYTLLVPDFIEDMAKVMTFGAKKYEDWNWLGLEPKRLKDSLARHTFNYLAKGSEIDEETGLDELAHIAVNCMMLSALKKIENAKTS